MDGIEDKSFMKEEAIIKEETIIKEELDLDAWESTQEEETNRVLNSGSRFDLRENPENERRARNTGKEYMNRQGQRVPARSMKNSCTVSSRQPCHLDCARKLIPENRREKIFQYFWNLPDRFKKYEFICRHVRLIQPRKRKLNPSTSKMRNYSRFYFLPLDGKLVRVCRTTFTATLDINEQWLSTAFKKFGHLSSGLQLDESELELENVDQNSTEEFETKFLVGEPDPLDIQQAKDPDKDIFDPDESSMMHLRSRSLAEMEGIFNSREVVFDNEESDSNSDADDLETHENSDTEEDAADDFLGESGEEILNKAEALIPAVAESEKQRGPGRPSTILRENMEPSPGEKRRKHQKDFSADVNHAESERSLSEKEEQLHAPPKKKLKSFSYAEKKKILEELYEMPSEIICKKYDLSERTLRYWKSQEENIFENAKNINLRNAKRIRDTQERDNQLLQWLVKNQNEGVSISGPLLKRQALIENKNLLGPSSFKASDGWLSGWKKRKNIRCLKITGERHSADAAAAEEYTKGEMPKLIATKQLQKKQIFNFDESCLYTKQIPGTKKQLDRLTFGACCNADGSMKLPLVVIGKSVKPRCFKNLSMDELPVFYRSQKNAWMVTEIFEEWFTYHFVPQVKAFLESENLPLVAVLIVDRCKSHKYLKVDGIDVQFLPLHVTSLIQPCDQGILEMIKLNYKMNLVHSILESQTKGVSLLQFLKNCNVKDFVYWAAQAWNLVEPSTIIQCWKKMLLVQTQDATTQTDGECSSDLLLLDSSSGTESVLIQEANEIVGKLVAAIRKVEGYEAISEKAISEWFKKIDDENEKEVSKMKIKMEI